MPAWLSSIWIAYSKLRNGFECPGFGAQCGAGNSGGSSQRIDQTWETLMRIFVVAEVYSVIWFW